MYKLTIVSGPRGVTPRPGSTYRFEGGAISIGRMSENGVVLQFSNVSKKHCTLVVNNGQVVMKDEGSSNGTFVNGVPAKNRVIKPGDRIGVGDFILELSQSAEARAASKPLNNLVALPGVDLNGINASGGASLLGTPGASEVPNAMPQDLKGKVIWFFEERIMPYFYNLNLKHEWKIIGIGLLSAFVVANLFISVQPLTVSGRQAVIKEVMRRARLIAQQIVEKNTAALAAKMETKTEIGSLEKEQGVNVAYLTDLESRILAPASRLGQYFTEGPEAVYARQAKKEFAAGRETGFVKELNDTTVVAVEPVKILHPQLGKNVVVGMAIVSIDTTLSTLSFADHGVIYSETIILTGLLGALLFLILYRLTLKPFQVLNDDIDKVLKGDETQISRQYKFEELDPLWDIVDSALKRVVNSGDANSGGLSQSSLGAQELLPPFQMLGDAAHIGLVVCDEYRKITYLSPTFEEMSGIRSDNALGQDLASVARDQAFGDFSNDLFSRVFSGGDAVSEDFEFSGITYKMYAAAVGMSGSSPKLYVLAAMKAEG